MYSKEELLHIIRSLIGEVSSATADDVHEQALLRDDLGMDSLQIVDLAMLVEKETGIRIPQTDLDSVQTVSDAIDLVAEPQSTPAS